MYYTIIYLQTVLKNKIQTINICTKKPTKQLKIKTNKSVTNSFFYLKRGKCKLNLLLVWYTLNSAKCKRHLLTSRQKPATCG